MDKKHSSNMHVFFWQTREEFGFLSQWFKSGFVVDGEYYRYAEQYMMAAKARLFGDEETQDKIMSAKSPMVMKHLGRAVRGYDEAKWAAAGFDEVVKANFAKFSQNDKLKERLLATGDAVIAEASPKDSKWGIGIDAETASKTDETNWPGQNLLGKALMKVREMLRCGEDITAEVEKNKCQLREVEDAASTQRTIRAMWSELKTPKKNGVQRESRVVNQANDPTPPTDKRFSYELKSVAEQMNAPVVVSMDKKAKGGSNPLGCLVMKRKIVMENNG